MRKSKFYIKKFALSLFCVILFSYMLSRPGLPFGRLLNFFVIFTMLFNGGLVAAYIMYSQTFHIKNTLFFFIFA